VSPWRAWVTAWVALGCSSFAPAVPVQVADITFTEQVTQSFFVAKSDDEAYDLFRFLIGQHATEVLEKLQPDTALAAAGGALEARGTLMLTARLDPFDTSSYTVEGFGRFRVSTTAQDLKELLFDADFYIGNADQHALKDLAARKQIILPVVHDVQLHPSVLFARTKVDEDGHCIIPIESKKRATGVPVSCAAEGIGAPHRARYYVRVHLKELVPGEVYAVDNDRGHEVFRDDNGERRTFGCLRLGPAKALRILDLRGRDLVRRLPGAQGGQPDLATYDEWNVPDDCSGSAARG
jgi:hypothetical protein